MSTQKVAFAALFIAGGIVGTIPLFLRDSQAFTSGPSQSPAVATGVGASVGGSSSVGESLGTYGSGSLSRSELTTDEVFKLYEAEKKVYDTVQELLMQRYVQSFFEEFKSKNSYPSVEEAQNAYFEQKARVADAEVKAFLEQNKSNPSLQRIPEDQREEQIRRYLENQARSGVVRQIANDGRRLGKVVAAIQPPAEPRVDVDDGSNFFMGPKNAPVTIVEFADFQCPFCARMVPTLTEVMRKYDGKVRWVYRDFPLMEIHPEALPAAVAANCAGGQGKYFEMHHQLFENLRTLSSETYTRLAQGLSLDMDKFNECLQDPAQRQEVLADMQKGQELGVQGTPAYFVNGRRISGGVDVAELSRMIEEELGSVN